MAKTLLAVDDSVTMRKVLEITFSGEDFRVISADSSQSALAKLSENPSVFVIDTMLGGEDGYSLARELRKRSPGAPIIMLASRYSPYDQARGRDSGADDWADKPFDTQQLIDKVRKVMLSREAGAQPTAPPATAPAYASAAQPAFRPAAQPQPVAAGADLSGSRGGGLPRGTQPSLAASVPRTGTLVFGEMPQQVAPVAPPRPAPVAPTPQAMPAVQPPPPFGATAAIAAAPIAAATNGHLASKLSELGLTPQQADAVLSLSREVVERVVWEVVPQLAEAIIKEEIVRLTKA